MGAALAGLVAMLCLAVAAVAAGLAAHGSAVNAADAAALAAAPVTFRPFGATGSPADEARRFAHLNGSRLVACRCPSDPTWRPRTVSVTVERTLSIPVIGRVAVRATARATFNPLLLLPETP